MTLDQSQQPETDIAADWAVRVRHIHPGLSASDIDALRCAYLNGGAFAMLGILIAARVPTDA